VDIHMFYGSNTAWRPSTIYKPIGSDIKKSKERTNAETFRNQRAQFYWMLRDKFFATYLAIEHNKYTDPEDMISLAPDIEDMKLLRSEVCRIPRKYNSTGKIQIMNKQEMRSLKIQSPNIADSMMMSMLPYDFFADTSPIDFETVY